MLGFHTRTSLSGGRPPSATLVRMAHASCCGFRPAPPCHRVGVGVRVRVRVRVRVGVGVGVRVRVRAGVRDRA